MLLSLSIIRAAAKIDGGLPKKLYSMMMFNIIVDVICGFVPIVGDLADFAWRANTRNAWLIDAYLQEKAEALRVGVIRDPEDEHKAVAVPVEMIGDDVEQGLTAAGTARPAPAAPAAVPPARTPAPKANNAPAPQTGAPGRSLTGPGKPSVRPVDNSRRSRR